MKIPGRCPSNFKSPRGASTKFGRATGFSQDFGSHFKDGSSPAKNKQTVLDFITQEKNPTTLLAIMKKSAAIQPPLLDDGKTKELIRAFADPDSKRAEYKKQKLGGDRLDYKAEVATPMHANSKVKIRALANILCDLPEGDRAKIKGYAEQFQRISAMNGFCEPDVGGPLLAERDGLSMMYNDLLLKYDILESAKSYGTIFKDEENQSVRNKAGSSLDCAFTFLADHWKEIEAQM